MTRKIEFLEKICVLIHRAEENANIDRRREQFGDVQFTELLLMRKDKVRVEIRKENTSHHEPHMHVTHTDKIDVSISLQTFEILDGYIDSYTAKHLRRVLEPNKVELLSIWNELNEKDNSIQAAKLIDALKL